MTTIHEMTDHPQKGLREASKTLVLGLLPILFTRKEKYG